MTASTNNPTVAIVQQPPVFLNLKKSLKRLEEILSGHEDENLDLAVVGETWLTGYPLWLDDAPNAAIWDHPGAKELYRVLVKNSLRIPGPEFDELRDLARDNNLHLVIGVHELDGGTLYNTMLFLHRNGEDWIKRRKLVPTYAERLVWGRGDGSTLNVLDSEFGPVGGLICWEHWMPLARAVMHSQNEVIHISQWPTAHDLHQVASRNYAFEGQCYVLASGATLSKKEMIEGAASAGVTAPGLELLESIEADENGLVMRGGSAIIAPDSTYLVGPVFNTTDTVMATLDLDKVTEAKLFLDSDGHYSRPDLFTLTVNSERQRNVEWKNS